MLNGGAAMGGERRVESTAPGRVRQALFAGFTGDGSKMEFVALGDGRCAVLRDGEVVRCGGRDAASVEELVSWFSDHVGSGSAG